MFTYIGPIEINHLCRQIYRSSHGSYGSLFNFASAFSGSLFQAQVAYFQRSKKKKLVGPNVFFEKESLLVATVPCFSIVAHIWRKCSCLIFFDYFYVCWIWVFQVIEEGFLKNIPYKGPFARYFVMVIWGTWTSQTLCRLFVQIVPYSLLYWGVLHQNIGSESFSTRWAPC